MHDATKVLMGQTKSSFRVSGSAVGSIAAGKVVVAKSDGTLTTTLSDGAAVGVSLGKDLSDTNRMSYIFEGNGVPVLLGSGFTPTIGAQVQFHATDGTAVASGTAVNAYFTTAVLTGELEDGTEANVALVNMVGGL